MPEVTATAFPYAPVSSRQHRLPMGVRLYRQAVQPFTDDGEWWQEPECLGGGMVLRKVGDGERAEVDNATPLGNPGNVGGLVLGQRPQGHGQEGAAWPIGTRRSRGSGGQWPYAHD